jgi:hypothetical protein
MKGAWKDGPLVTKEKDQASTSKQLIDYASQNLLQIPP